ncbi:MAG: ABC transporter permease, partial [Ignavibacteria bacterium]
HNFTRMRNVFTDFGYLSTLGLKLKTGRNFSKEFSTDKYSVILNEKSVKTFGWEIDEALGKRILINLLDSTYRTVIGVVEDYHFISLKQKIEPLVIAAVPDYRVIAVKIKPANLPGYIKEIENIYSRFSPGYPFEYQFLDDSFNQLYTSEKKQEDIFSLFSFLAIFISCLGLFGLASFSAEQRIKEIGIRKVLGATVPEIFVLISTQFLKLVVVANVIAWPFAYFLMDKWLEDFEYRINIALWTFIIAGISALMIAVITVSYQAIKAATANPVKSLRYE